MFSNLTPDETLEAPVLLLWEFDCLFPRFLSCSAVEVSENRDAMSLSFLSWIVVVSAASTADKRHVAASKLGVLGEKNRWRLENERRAGLRASRMIVPVAVAVR